MHIVILADPLDNQRAGVHIFTKNLIEGLLKIDKQNHYTFIHRKENPFFDDKNHLIIPGKKIKGYESYRKFLLLPKIVKNLNPDIVLEPAHIGPFNLPKHIKRAVLIHDLTPILFPQFHIKKSPRTHRLLLPRILRNADLILTPSENTKKDIQKHYKTNSPIQTIYAGPQSPVPNSNQTSNRPIQEPYILFLGTLEPRKNLPTLIDAFLELKKEKNTPHKLVLAGGIGWKTESLIKKAQNPEIIITDYLSEQEKQSWLKHADLFVYPSFYEGFGIPPLEAMQHNLPVITSTGGSLKEIYQDTTLQFEAQDKETLKKHIQSIIENPHLREKLKEKGNLLLQKYTWENTARKTLQAFESINR